MNSLDIAQNAILRPHNLDFHDLQKVLASINTRKIDAADLYFQHYTSESWYLEDSEVKSGSHAHALGVGLRAVSADKTAYAYCEDLLMPTIMRAASVVSAIAPTNNHDNAIIHIQPAHNTQIHYMSDNPFLSLSSSEKLEILQNIDSAARKYSPKVTQVNASLSAEYEIILFMDLNGLICADVRPMMSLNVSVICQDKQRRESGRYGCGGRFTYKEFFQGKDLAEYAALATEQALINLEAKDAPAGTMPVVLGPGWPGVLLHEAVGHGLEGDFNRKKLSVFSGRMGEKVAASCVTVVDNGAITKRRGSLNIDDEGTPTQNTTLIENGILVNYMQDKLNARLMGMQSTGNCRRESYACMPMPRMTNTYMLAGESSVEEIIASVDYGLYALNFSGGQVDITSGQFVFSASLAYLIENGKISYPVKGATIVGNGPEVMQKITMVGADLELDHGIGVCGKDGQSVPVGVGQPTLKISELTVGGTK
jgi:TldD protein